MYGGLSLRSWKIGRIFAIRGLRHRHLFGESILAERSIFIIPFPMNSKSTMTDLVKLDMLDFDVILGMDLLHDCYASVDCRTWVAMFQLPNDPVIECKSSSIVP